MIKEELYLRSVYMKVFISWSGELSKAIAESIKKWLPCIIQSADVFFSPDDIEKGENWDTKITKELLECKYGIVCLTEENVSAPWIHFEAGALAKTLDSRVATLMINVSPTEIKGPLSRYQATKLERDDFFQLINNINSQSDNPIKPEVLKTLFDSLWENIYKEFDSLISKFQKTSSGKKRAINNNEALEEILLLLRKQNSILSSPNQLFPMDYFSNLVESINNDKTNEFQTPLVYEVLHYLNMVLSKCEEDKEFRKYALELKLDKLIEVLGFYINKKTSRRLHFQYREIRDHFDFLYKKENMPELLDNNDIK